MTGDFRKQFNKKNGRRMVVLGSILIALLYISAPLSIEQAIGADTSQQVDFDGQPMTLPASESMVDVGVWAFFNPGDAEMVLAMLIIGGMFIIFGMMMLLMM